MSVTTPLGDALSRYLDLTADQMKLTAGNMANIDTPGYKTQGFDFSQAFSNALSHTGDSTPAASDGNTVSIDRESMQLAKSQLQFKTGVELLRHEFTRVMSAIHAETK
jgi:flagellar basal-body rod protein FlgB